MVLDIKDIILIGLAVIVLVLIGLVIGLLVNNKKVYRAYDSFMRGRDAESLEDLIRNAFLDIETLKEEDETNKEAIRALNKVQRASIQKTGIVHYNAFKGMGGNLSFALALLDYTNTGVIINSVHSREGCYVYVKTVDRGRTDIVLGTEEKAALEEALGYSEAE